LCDRVIVLTFNGTDQNTIGYVLKVLKSYAQAVGTSIHTAKVDTMILTRDSCDGVIDHQSYAIGFTLTLFRDE
jgi:hypothetical protein